MRHQQNLTSFTVLIDSALRDEIKLNALRRKMNIRNYLNEIIKVGMKNYEKNK